MTGGQTWATIVASIAAAAGAVPLIKAATPVIKSFFGRKREAAEEKRILSEATVNQAKADASITEAAMSMVKRMQDEISRAWVRINELEKAKEHLEQKCDVLEAKVEALTTENCQQRQQIAALQAAVPKI